MVNAMQINLLEAIFLSHFVPAHPRNRCCLTDASVEGEMKLHTFVCVNSQCFKLADKNNLVCHFDSRHLLKELAELMKALREDRTLRGHKQWRCHVLLSKLGQIDLSCSFSTILKRTNDAEQDKTEPHKVQVWQFNHCEQ